MNFKIENNTILVTLSGSRAYGTNTEESDVDIKGVAIAPIDAYFGISNNFEQCDDGPKISAFTKYLSPQLAFIAAATKFEGTIFELRKFISLAAENNPNILEVLFSEDENVLFESDIGRELRKNRELFLCARAKYSFSGYAFSQLKRIKTHRNWILNPKKRKPTRQEFGLSDVKSDIPSDQRAAIESAINKKIDSWNLNFNFATYDEMLELKSRVSQYLTELNITSDHIWKSSARLSGVDENYILYLDKERRYKSAMNEYKQYESWLLDRNKQRAALEEKFGYDTKHAMHLYRLMNMCLEILETGKLTVNRKNIDAEELKYVRSGGLSYEELLAWFTEINKKVDKIYTDKKYVVPYKCDSDLINKLSISLIKKFHS